MNDSRDCTDLVLFGSGGHAKVVLEAIRACTPQRRVVVLDDNPAASNRKVLGTTISGTREWLLENGRGWAVALGIGDNRARGELLEWLREEAFRVATIMHPSAIIGATVRIGEGAFLAAGSIIVADTTIGAGAIVNTGASVDHDCAVSEVVHIAPGARLCGNVSIGTRSLIGVGAVVRPNVVIGADVVVGAGSAVICALPDGGVYAGSPARLRRSLGR